MWRRAELTLVLFDRELALCSGVDAGRLTVALLVVVAVAIGAAIRLTGALLVDALTLLPALGARNLGRSLTSMVRWSVALGLAGNLAGFGVALALDLPPPARPSSSSPVC
ncbi:MAG: metal ABC transporter permease [Egibacteraceae bacterium]